MELISARIHLSPLPYRYDCPSCYPHTDAKPALGSKAIEKDKAVVLEPGVVRKVIILESTS